MSTEAKTVSRSELYEQVWSRPMIEVCKDYGISNVGLGKLCKRHDIPCPYRGYWARKAAGQQPDRTPLPKRTDDRPISIQPFQSIPPIAAELQDEVSEELDHVAPIPVRETLHGCHSLVSRTRQAMEGIGADANGLLVSPPEAPLQKAHAARMVRDDMERAGLPIFKPGEGHVDFHALRTTYLTLLDMGGASAKETQDLARHSTPVVTFNAYVRAGADRKMKVVEALGALLQAPVGTHPEPISQDGQNAETHKAL